MKHSRVIVATLLMSALAGCASKASNPSVAMLPPPGKALDQFQAEDNQCRQYAASAAGTSTPNITNPGTATSAASGALSGASQGATAGTVGGPVGAMAGAAGGAALGAVNGVQQTQNNDVQGRYNVAYQQCMAAKGNVTPGQQAPQPQQ